MSACTVESHAAAKASPTWHTWMLHQRAQPGDSVAYLDAKGRQHHERVYVAMEIRTCPACGQLVACLVEHLPPVPTMPGIETIGGLRAALERSGWKLSAGRDDGENWAVITFRSGDMIGAKGEDLNEAISAVLHLAAKHSHRTRSAGLN